MRAALADRGLADARSDASAQNVVINYDAPDSADSYLHRVGRAGRFGTKGLAITMVATTEDQGVLDSIQSRCAWRRLSCGFRQWLTARTVEVAISTLPDTVDPATYSASSAAVCSRGPR